MDAAKAVQTGTVGLERGCCVKIVRSNLVSREILCYPNKSNAIFDVIPENTKAICFSLTKFTTVLKFSSMLISCRQKTHLFILTSYVFYYLKLNMG